MKVAILAMEGLFDTGLFVTLDTFWLANTLSAMRMGGAPHFEVNVVGVRKRVRSGQGQLIAVSEIKPSVRPDWVIVPALTAGTPELLTAALQRKDVCDGIAQLQRWHAKGVRIAASCIGSFLVAEAGLLDDLEATTTWWLAPFFRQRYPEVSLDETRMIVPSGNIVTTGAMMGHLDLAIWLVRQASPELEAVLSRYMLSDIRSSQAQYIIPNHLAQADPVVQRFERWAREHLKYGFSLQDAAKELAITGRTLQRRCEAVLGKSPLAYFQDLRVERARSLLHGSSLDVDSIAAEVGYEDGATLRTLLRERLGRGVRELRSDVR